MLETAWVINQTDSTSTLKFLALIVLFCIKCLQLPRFKAKCCRYFNSLEICFLLIQIFSHIFPVIYIYIYIYAFFNHKVLTFMALLTFSFALFNYGPNSTYVNIFCIVSFDVIRPLRGLSFNQGFTKFLIILIN